MKKRLVITLVLVGLLAFGAGMGTMAYYSDSFTSNNNLVRAAKYKVTSNGTLDQSMDLKDIPFIPESEGIVREFQVDKTGTEVPVEYTITYSTTGGLFDANTPINLYLERQVNDTDIEHQKVWERIGWGEAIEADFDIENFRITWDWYGGTNDLAYQDKTGNIKITVNSQQIVPEKPVIASVYTREKFKVQLEDGSWSDYNYNTATENLVVQFEGTKAKGRTLTIKGTNAFGDVIFEFEPDSNNGVMTYSSKTPEYIGKTFELSQEKDGYFQMQCNKTNIQFERDGLQYISFQPHLHVTMPTGTALDWLGLE